MSGYAKPEAGEWVRPVRRGYKMACCDCCLVHRMDFRVVPYGRGHTVEFRVWRHTRATATMRRRNGIRLRTAGASVPTLVP